MAPLLDGGEAVHNAEGVGIGMTDQMGVIRMVQSISPLEQYPQGPARSLRRDQAGRSGGC